MPSVPDDQRERHDPQPGTGSPPGRPAAVTLAGLRQQYGADWEILVHLDSSIVSAEHRSGDGGRAVRYIVAHSLAELATKLETAGLVEP